MSTKSSAVAIWSNHAAVYKDKGFLALVAKTKPEKTLVQSKLLTRPSDRKLLEFCCSETSRLGQDRFVASGCAVVRLTAKDDLTTDKGLQKALEEVRSTSDGEPLHLWGSLPCTAGSPWQRLNKKHSNARRLMRCIRMCSTSSSRTLSLSPLRSFREEVMCHSSGRQDASCGGSLPS